MQQQRINITTTTDDNAYYSFDCNKNINLFVDKLQYEETNDAHEFSAFRALLLATRSSNCKGLRLGQSHRTIFAATNEAFQKYVHRYVTSISAMFEDEYLLCELAKKTRFKQRIYSKDFIDGRVFEEWEDGVNKRAHIRVVNQDRSKREIYVTNAKVISSYSTCNDTVTVHAIDDLMIESKDTPGNALAMYKLPSLYDFLEYSAFAEDVSISLEALYVAFGYVKIFQNAGSARTVLIPSNDAWRIFFAETSLTKSMLFKDESNHDQLKSIVLRFLVSSFQQLKASSGAMKSFAQSYGGDDLPFILVEDIHTSDGLLMIVSRLPLLEMRVEKYPASKFFDPVFLLQKNARVSLYKNLLQSESQIIDFLQQELPAISSSNRDGGVKTRSVIGVLAPTNAAFRDALRYLNVQTLLSPSNNLNVTDDERTLLKLITQQIITYNTFRILEADAVALESAAQDGVTAEIDFNSLDSYLTYPILRRPGNVFMGNPIAKKLKITKQKSENVMKVRGMLNSASILHILSSNNGLLIVTDELLIPPTAELGLSLSDRLERIPFAFLYRNLLAYLGLSPELRSGWNDAIVFLAHDLPMISTLSGVDINITSNNASNSVNVSSLFVNEDDNMIDEALYDIIMRNIWFNHLQKDTNLYHESYISLDVHNLDENVNCFQTLNDATASDTCNRFNREDVFDANSENVARNAYLEVLEQDNNTETFVTTQTRQIIGDSQLALNGEVYVISSLLIPNFYKKCSRLPDFSLKITGNDTQSQIFAIDDLYGKVKKRFSVETVIKTFKRQILANSSIFELNGSAYDTYDNMMRNGTSSDEVDVFTCDPWCLGPTTWIFCKPCRGEQFQVIFSIGGFAPYQPSGGAMILAVSDTNELYFGVSQYVATFNLGAIDAGGGLRLIDGRVKAIGVTMPLEKPVRILATYDGYANITKIYVNGKFCGVGSLDGYQFEPFDGDDTPPSLRIGTLGTVTSNSSSFFDKQPAFLKLFPRLQSMYDNDVQNRYLDYAGQIDAVNVWFDYVKYPSTCYN